MYEESVNRILWQIILGIIIALSCVLNLALVRFVGRQPEWTLRDKLIISLAVSDLVRGVLGYLSELLLQRYLEDKTDDACLPSGFFVSLLSYAAITHLGVISIDRWFTVKSPFQARNIHRSSFSSFLAVLFCWLYSLLFALMPVFNFGQYGFEQKGLRCSVIWKQQKLSGKIFVLLLFVFMFFLPLALIILSYIFVQKCIRESRRRVGKVCQNDTYLAAIKMRIRAEKRNTAISFTTAFVFVIAWTPYAIVSFIAAFSDAKYQIADIIQSLAVIPAKASTLCNPVIFAVYQRQFRACLKAFCPRANRIFPARRTEMTVFEKTVPETGICIVNDQEL